MWRNLCTERRLKDRELLRVPNQQSIVHFVNKQKLMSDTEYTRIAHTNVSLTYISRYLILDKNQDLCWRYARAIQNRT